MIGPELAARLRVILLEQAEANLRNAQERVRYLREQVEADEGTGIEHPAD